MTGPMTTNGVDAGFVGEPAGTLNSMTTGGLVVTVVGLLQGPQLGQEAGVLAALGGLALAVMAMARRRPKR